MKIQKRHGAPLAGHQRRDEPLTSSARGRGSAPGDGYQRVRRVVQHVARRRHGEGHQARSRATDQQAPPRQGTLTQAQETGQVDDPDDGALLTGSSSIHHSLKCAIAVGEQLGHERPDWELSLGALAVAIAHRPNSFLDKDRWAMDWYYPILGGVLRGYPANGRVAARWAQFVVEGRGIRCVSDRPWITAAETCELVMALDAIGSDAHARQLFTWAQFLRADGGGYWTGANFEGEAFHLDGEFYTADQPTWNSAAVVLAANALAGTGPTAGLFRGERLPEGLGADQLLAAGVEIERERTRRE